MSTQAIGFHLCVDGPLKGELHNRGPRFGFDGSPLGLDRGVYALEDGQYLWRADSRPRSVVLVRSSHRTNLSVSSPSAYHTRRLA